jgi:hypothetical protein
MHEYLSSDNFVLISMFDYCCSTIFDQIFMFENFCSNIMNTKASTFDETYLFEPSIVGAC